MHCSCPRTRAIMRPAVFPMLLASCVVRCNSLLGWTTTTLLILLPLATEEGHAKNFHLLYSDPLWNASWHIRSGSAMNILPTWSLGYTGQGVNLVNIDSGIDHTHSDLFFSFDPLLGLDLVDNDTNPFVNNVSHGTEMAGLIGAQGNNSKCSVGIAYDVNLGHVRLGLDADDETRARALSFARERVDIYVLGIGAKDLDSWGSESDKRMKEGTAKGRGGKGNIFLSASGNSGLDQGSCALDTQINFRYGIAIAAVGQSGSKAFYGEECAAILASAFSGGRYPDPPLVTTSVNNSCVENFSGTSGSVAVAGGVLALVLQANPRLTWRDMQHLIVRSSRRDIIDEIDAQWITNGVGHKFSTAFGFGLLDALQLVKNAQKWKKSVRDQETCLLVNASLAKLVQPEEKAEILLDFSSRNCPIRKLEHVVVTILELEAHRRGDVRLELTSPSKTEVIILKESRYDISWEGFKDQRILSLATWDENPIGSWKLKLQHTGNVSKASSRPFTVKGVKLEIFGTALK